MGLPDWVALKFGAYTLACHHFTAHLPALGKATQDDTRRTAEACCAVFDKALADFVQASSSDLPKAVSQLGGLLRSQADLFRGDNRAAASVFDQVIAAMNTDALDWDYVADIRQMHDLGRDLARRFYANSPHAVTQERCIHECPLEFAYGAPDEEDDWPTMGVLPLSYRAAPVAFRPKSKKIIVRFNFDNDLALYLAYPFLFLHEYTAHIYATDHGNDLFNDGWMLHAAADFLQQQRNRADPLTATMPYQQATIFYQHFFGIIKERQPISWRGCCLARDLASLIGCIPGRFNVMSYELAAFAPSSGRSKKWPTQLLIQLKQELEHNPAVLLDKIQSVANLSDLYAILAPV
jgi:hypothetical protein